MNRVMDPRRGTVFVVVDPPDVAGDSVGRVDGYWDGDPGFIEQLPEGLSLDSALEWARERATRILVRNDDPTFPMPTGRYFWAGDAPCPPDVEPMS